MAIVRVFISSPQVEAGDAEGRCEAAPYRVARTPRRADMQRDRVPVQRKLEAEGVGMHDGDGQVATRKARWGR